MRSKTTPPDDLSKLVERLRNLTVEFPGPVADVAWQAAIAIRSLTAERDKLIQGMNYKVEESDQLRRDKAALTARVGELEARSDKLTDALGLIVDGYGQKHDSKFCLSLACAGLSTHPLDRPAAIANEQFVKSAEGPIGLDKPGES